MHRSVQFNLSPYVRLHPLRQVGAHTLYGILLHLNVLVIIRTVSRLVHSNILSSNCSVLYSLRILFRMAFYDTLSWPGRSRLALHCSLGCDIVSMTRPMFELLHLMPQVVNVIFSLVAPAFGAALFPLGLYVGWWWPMYLYTVYPDTLPRQTGSSPLYTT